MILHPGWLIGINTSFNWREKVLKPLLHSMSDPLLWSVCAKTTYNMTFWTWHGTEQPPL